MLKTFYKILAVAVAVFIIVAALQPSDYRIERSLVINAPASTIFAQVNDLHKWNAWSPWSKIDPNAKETFEGPARGKGATMHWDGNKDVGAGSMTISESKPNSLIQLQLAFLKPMKNEANAEFTFTPEGKGTKVTWAMYGKNGLLGKAIGLIMDCEKMIGDMHEQGLNNLKAVVKG